MNEEQADQLITRVEEITQGGDLASIQTELQVIQELLRELIATVKKD